MHHRTVAAVARRFPLVGRPRPDCPPLPLRIKEIADAANAATRTPDHAIAEAAHALNKAALIASDAGLPDLARQLCWRHIDAYRHLTRPLTVLEARYMLEPVLNLARLQIRVDQGIPALRLIEAMYHAVTQRTDLTIGEHTLPTANLTGDPAEHRELRQWVWLQLVSEGVRILALANRWADAAEHAHKHNGIGAHLLEGRQAAIIAACLDGKPEQGRKILAESTLTQPWEQQVAACLDLLLTEPESPPAARRLGAAVERLTLAAAANYASFHVRLGLTVAILANATEPELAAQLLSRTAKQAIDIGDGYAARDLLGIREHLHGITGSQAAALRRTSTRAGLGLGALPEAVLHDITTTCGSAVSRLNLALQARQ
ncbi:hypothetical protein [Polymorphospora rubra]|uniref:hypothetical protein n=1 Tax=Polymorphospora rubra TaxID=338584 RepID=UPI0033D7FF22